MARFTVCKVDELPVGAHRTVVVSATRSVGVFNIHGTLVGVLNSCPHAGAPLCRGVLTGTAVADGARGRRWAHEGEILRCPWHGWEFKLPEGTTISEPTIKVRTYPVFIEDDQVILEVGSAAAGDGATGAQKAVAR